MEKDNVRENKIRNEEEEAEVKTSSEENSNTEIENLVSDENNTKESFSKVFLSNILDQSLMIAGSAIILLLLDLILHVFGYQFVRETGAIVIAGAIVYFILNCIYEPIMENSKFKNTIGKKILNI